MNPSYSMNRNTSLRGVFALVLASLLLGAAVVLTASAFADSARGTATMAPTATRAITVRDRTSQRCTSSAAPTTPLTARST